MTDRKRESDAKNVSTGFKAAFYSLAIAAAVAGSEGALGVGIGIAMLKWSGIWIFVAAAVGAAFVRVAAVRRGITIKASGLILIAASSVPATAVLIIASINADKSVIAVSATALAVVVILTFMELVRGRSERGSNVRNSYDRSVVVREINNRNKGEKGGENEEYQDTYD